MLQCFISFSYKYHLNEANVLKEYVNNNNDFHVVNIENKKIEDEKKFIIGLMRNY